MESAAGRGWTISAAGQMLSGTGGAAGRPRRATTSSSQSSRARGTCRWTRQSPPVICRVATSTGPPQRRIMRHDPPHLRLHRDRQGCRTVATQDRPRVGRRRRPDQGRRNHEIDRKSVVEGKSVSVRVDSGGRRIINKKNNQKKIKE